MSVQSGFLTSVNIRSDVSVYLQIRNAIQFAIASGFLKSGDRLPTQRELGDRLGVNINTVVKAYRDLETMGLVSSRRGMGVWVNKDVQDRCSERCCEEIAARLHEVASEARAAGMNEEDMEEIVSKSMNLESPPYGETPEEILALVRKKAE